jgi:hypothetical protein
MGFGALFAAAAVVFVFVIHDEWFRNLITLPHLGHGGRPKPLGDLNLAKVLFTMVEVFRAAKASVRRFPVAWRS